MGTLLDWISTNLLHSSYQFYHFKDEVVEDSSWSSSSSPSTSSSSLELVLDSIFLPFLILRSSHVRAMLSLLDEVALSQPILLVMERDCDIKDGWGHELGNYKLMAFKTYFSKSMQDIYLLDVHYGFAKCLLSPPCHPLHRLCSLHQITCQHKGLLCLPYSISSLSHDTSTAKQCCPGGLTHLECRSGMSGLRTMLCVWMDRVPQGNYGHRFFKCPDLDDYFMVTTTKNKSFVSQCLFSTWPWHLPLHT